MLTFNYETYSGTFMTIRTKLRVNKKGYYSHFLTYLLQRLLKTIFL